MRVRCDVCWKWRRPPSPCCPDCAPWGMREVSGAAQISIANCTHRSSSLRVNRSNELHLPPNMDPRVSVCSLLLHAICYMLHVTMLHSMLPRVIVGPTALFQGVCVAARSSTTSYSVPPASFAGGSSPSSSAYPPHHHRISVRCFAWRIIILYGCILCFRGRQISYAYHAPCATGHGARGTRRAGVKQGA